MNTIVLLYLEWFRIPLYLYKFADELLAVHVPELIRKNYDRSQGTERYTGLGKGGEKKNTKMSSCQQSAKF